MNESEPSTLSPELLLAHGEWMSRLARTLVFDEQQADDLVQETWLKALTRPPKSTERVRGWLATVLRNQARRSRRSDVRAREREASVARPVETASTAELVAELTTKKDVVEVVLGLEDPYREALLMRYYREMSSADIARAKGVPVNTAKSWVTRGLAQMRSQLGRKHGSDSAWQKALLPLIGIPASTELPSRVAVIAGVTTGVLAMKVTTVLASIVVLLVGTFYVLRPATYTMQPQSPGIESEGPSASESYSKPGAGQDSANERTVRQSTASGSRAPVSEAPPHEEGLLIEVTKQDRPVPGALVTSLHPESITPADLVALQSMVLDMFTLVRTRGTTRRTDAAGTVRVPEGTLHVMAVHDGTRGMLGREELQGEKARLALHPARIAQVRVEDTQGRPVAGVPVVFGMASPGQPPSSTDLEAHAGILPVVKVTSDANGMATSDTVFDAMALYGEGAETLAMIDAPTQPRHTVAIEALRPAKLILDAHASVVISVVHAGGEPVEQEAWVNLCSLPASAAPDAAPPAMHVRRLENGRATYPCVGLDLHLMAQVITPMNSSEAVRKRFFGPVSAGETHRVTVVVGDERKTIVGRLVDEQGEPLTSRSFSANLDVQGSVLMANLETDAQGRFRFVLPSEPFAEGTRRQLVLSLMMGAMPVTSGQERGAHIDLSRAFPPGETDLGDVLFGRPDVILRGHVLDEGGQRLAGASVSATVRSGEGHFDTRVPTVRTADDGTFALRARLQPGRALDLQVRLEGYYVLEAPTVRVGTSDAVITMTRGASMQGKILLGEGIPGDLLRIRCRSGDAGRRISGSIEKDGTFAVSGLRPGLYRLELLPVGQHRATWTLEDVRVMPEAQDPRLEQIDLRDRFTLLRTRLVDEKRRPLRGARVEVSAGEASSVLACDRKGHLRGLFDAPVGSQATLLVKERRSAEVVFGNVPEDVILRKGIEVELRCSSLPELRDGAKVEVGLKATLEAGARFQGMPHSFRSGKLRLLVPEPGHYEVTWMLFRKSGHGQFSGHYVNLEEPQEIVITEAEALQTCTVRCPEKEIRAELERSKR